MATIPSGYQLSISTWENDADNFSTKTFNGLTAEDTRFYLRFLQFFIHLGNKEVFQGECNHEKDAIELAYAEFPPSSPELIQEVVFSNLHWKINPKDRFEWVEDLIGTWFEGEKYRVIRRVDVHFIPEPIEDVSEQFRKITQEPTGLKTEWEVVPPLSSEG